MHECDEATAATCSNHPSPDPGAASLRGRSLALPTMDEEEIVAAWNRNQELRNRVKLASRLSSRDSVRGRGDSPERGRAEDKRSTKREGADHLTGSRDGAHQLRPIQDPGSRGVHAIDHDGPQVQELLSRVRGRAPRPKCHAPRPIGERRPKLNYTWGFTRMTNIGRENERLRKRMIDIRNGGVTFRSTINLAVF